MGRLEDNAAEGGPARQNRVPAWLRAAGRFRLRAAGSVPVMGVGLPVSWRAERAKRVADRLRAYGFGVPLRPPHHFDALDEQLLRRDAPLGWVGVTTADAMPFAEVMVAARDLLTPHSVLVERLTGYGIKVSCPDVPDGLSFTAALELLRISEHEDMFLTIDCEIDLHDLIERAEVSKAPVAQVARWLRELGLTVPDLTQTLRDALARVPRISGDGGTVGGA